MNDTYPHDASPEEADTYPHVVPEPIPFDL
jgi:hypothetical protein